MKDLSCVILVTEVYCQCGNLTGGLVCIELLMIIGTCRLLLRAMSVQRTLRRQRLFKCDFKRSLTQYNDNTKILARGFKNSALGCQFRILFMGRDKFSCTVLEEVFKARGRYVCMKVEVYNELLFYPQTDEACRRVGRDYNCNST